MYVYIQPNNTQCNIFLTGWSNEVSVINLKNSSQPDSTATEITFAELVNSVMACLSPPLHQAVLQLQAYKQKYTTKPSLLKNHNGMPMHKYTRA